MFRFTAMFVILMQTVTVGLAIACVYALVFHPESVGATVAKIIVGFQNTMKGGA
jgi:hypothetical protein